jgi:hypothetical protein
VTINQKTAWSNAEGDFRVHSSEQEYIQKSSFVTTVKELTRGFTHCLNVSTKERIPPNKASDRTALAADYQRQNV